MKRLSSQLLRCAPFAAFCALVAAFCPFRALGQSTETIYDAIREGKVYATFTATGGSSGDAIYLAISKTPLAGSGTLNITVPPGLRLQNLNGAWQSMVVSGVRGLWRGGAQYTPQPLIILGDAAPSATYLLAAYCAEFHKDNPPPASQFVLSPPDSAAACILSNANAQGLTVAATQAAEWINTDRVTLNELQAKFPVSLPDWNAAVQVASQCRQASIQLSRAPLAPPEVQGNLLTVNSVPDNQPVSFQLGHVPFSSSITHPGTLTISPDHVGFEETGPRAHRSDNFEASCSALVTAGIRNPRHSLYIRLRNRNYVFDAGSPDGVLDVMRALSRVCPQIPSPGK